MCLLAGCTTTTMTQGDFRFNRLAIGNKTAIGKLTAEKDTAGVLKVSLESYSNDQVEAIKAIAEGVAKGLAEAAKKGATGGIAP